MAHGAPLDRRVIKLVTRALGVIVALDAVGLAIGCVLRRRRGVARREPVRRPRPDPQVADAQSTGVR